jgi:hypothetical protein
VTKATSDQSPFNKARLAVLAAKELYHTFKGDYAPDDTDAKDREEEGLICILEAQAAMRAGLYQKAELHAADAIRILEGN